MQVGASCLLLALPAPWIMINGDCFTAFFTVLLFTCSIMADYFFIHSIWDDIDRAVACSYIGWVVYLSLEPNGTLLTIGALVILIGCPFLYSRKSSSREQWAFRHCLWHMTAMIVQFGVMYGVFNPGIYGNAGHSI